ncbi:MAG: phosphoadenylyl-sulfate reductase [Bacteroidales bacterium]|nr:phosphoadenylyl-sulfate reductase [Bacteroidales bacterium]
MVNQLTKELEDRSIIDQLKILAEKFKNKIAFSTSFGLGDQVITDIIFSNNIPVKVFTLDTGRLFEDTYKVWDKTLKKYKKNIIPYFPNKEDVEKMVSEKGINSFYESPENRNECCRIRKVEPLNRALKDIDLWITGLRAEQSETRTELTFFEENKTYNLIKFNPVLKWSLDDIIKHIKTNEVPYNDLYNKGFISVGCAPCTRAVKLGEEIRAGRWWWESKEKKECGIHVSQNENLRFKIINYK